MLEIGGAKSRTRATTEIGEPTKVRSSSPLPDELAPPSSIIPSPGTPPAVEPTTTSVQLSGYDTYTIAADTQIYAVGINFLFNGYNSLVTNNGTVWFESNTYFAVLLTGVHAQVVNNGLIYLRGQNIAELGAQSEYLVNTGSIFAICESGWARVINSDVYPVFVENSGLIAAQSLGIDDSPDPVYTDFWNATAIDALGYLEVINHAGGRILAEAPKVAIAISSPAGDKEPGKPIVTNAGLIEANATGPDGVSIAIYVSQPGYEPATIVNSGTIRAEFAIFATSSAGTVSNPVEHVENQAGGVIDGLVVLDLGDDQFVNAGTVIGHVDMGAGDDVFSGSGSVSGVVDMGFDDDSYSGSAAGDRAAGGRGDDNLRGNGGRDLLLGGFGNDTLRGDSGKDGLFGEWGDDTLETLGGDYVEGGDGDDRVVLGDYSFEAVHGNGGTDTLVLDDGARNFSLAQMVAGGRIGEFEIIELKAGQQLALNAVSIAAVTGAQTLRIDAAAGNTVHLSGTWTHGADTTIGSTLYEVWTQGSAKVFVTEATTVTPLSTPSFGGLDPVATGAAALRPGASAGLDYTDPAYFMRAFPLFGDFTVDAAEIFYSDGAPVFYSERAPLTFTNNGAIYTLANAPPETLGIAWGLEFHGPTTMVNNGLIYVEELSPPRLGSFQPSFGVTMGGGADNCILENYDEISVYSVPGSAIGVQGIGVFRNEGLVAAISEHARAIAVNTVYGSHVLDDHQTFFNTGTIYAEAGGASQPAEYLGDALVPWMYAATGVAATGTLTNDGDIIAVLGPNADPYLVTVGVFSVNHYFEHERPGGVINNGTIEGTIAIKFAEDYTTDYSHWVVNNGLLIGDVQFEDGEGADEYDGSGGELRGTVYGYGSNDSFLGGQFGDSFDGGRGDDTLDGGGGSDRLVGGAGRDTLRGGAGADRFVFLAATDSSSSALDRIHDFQSGVDVIDLRWLGQGVTFTRSEQTEAGTGLVFTIVDVATSKGHMVFRVDGRLANSDFVIGVPIIGTGGDDQLSGGEVPDLIRGMDGADHLNGLDGDDVLEGGGGDDTLDGGLGADRMVGGAGDDSYYRENENDVVVEAAGGGIDTVHARFNYEYELEAGVENAVMVEGPGIHLYGNALANRLTGNSGENGLYGFEGNDFLDGGAGSDAMSGGPGNDVYLVDVSDAVIERDLEGIDEVRTALATYTLGDFVENLTGISASAQVLNGNNRDNFIVGAGGNDSLAGALGNDRLDGGAGSDSMAGGLGNDVYVVDQASDAVIEVAGEGADSVESFASHVLGANVENLALTGTSAINGTGNDLANNLTGNSAANRLNGAGGADAMAGGLGDDTYVVDLAGDTIAEAAGAGADVVEAGFSYTLGANVEILILTGTAAIDGTGNALANTLVGNAAANILNGGAGDDAMAGGQGDDIYVVDAAGDAIIEASGAGTDAVDAAASYTLGTNVENLTLTGAAAINGTGNALANAMTGNAAANVLDGGTGADTMTGGLGNDSYVVDDAGDVVVEAAGAGTDVVFSAITFALGANVEELSLTGAGAIDGTGNALANTLIGNSAANIINGGAGADAMAGGLGSDTYFIDNAGDMVTESAAAGTDLVQSSVHYTLGANIENLTLTGAAAINGTGNGLANLLTGNAAANNLDGGTGADTMQGDLGNDSYFIDNALDNVIETSAAGGIDQVTSAITFTLGANLEKLTLSGILAINGTGNALVNTLTGNSGANILDGGVGGDTMSGGLGNDTYVVDNALDKAIEAAGGGTDKVLSAISFTLGAEVENLTLTGSAAINGTGNALVNTIVGNGAANLLNGGVGNDTMQGGLGDDTYVVDNTLDKAIEAAGGGVDRVQSSVTFILGAEVENLTLTGAAAINGTGNGLANMLTGNAAANVLDGKAGADVMQGGAGDDTYVVDDPGDLVSDSSATGGIDLVRSAVSFTLGVNLENLTLTGSAVINATGNALANIIVGNAGANLIDGKGGADTMTGGAGDDTYFIDNAGDVAIETNAAHGVDTVRSGLSYTLGANIENLVLTGPGAIDGTGSSANNILTGNGAANVLSGLLGNDTLLGGGGADTLKGATGNDIMEGGTGADSFIFDSALDAATNVDHVVDFAHLADKLVLENARFSGLAPGALSASAFVVGTAAADASDRIIYDAATGALYFDKDGTGAAAQVQFATLDNMPVNLSASDFLVI